MRIDPKDTIAGYPSPEIRKLMRRAGQMWRAEFVSDVLEVAEAEAINLIERLAEEGYVKPVPERDDLWRTTLLGNRLANASAAQPLKRATADRIVSELLDRVDEVNSSEYYLYEVENVVVFGSYLTDRERINDIDLAVTLTPKEKDPERQFELEQQRAADAAEAGRHFRNFVEHLGWARNELLLFLKSRSRAISFHDPDEWPQLGVTGAVLYSKRDSEGREAG